MNKLASLTRKQGAVILMVITALYACAAFFSLGEIGSPQSYAYLDEETPFAVFKTEQAPHYLDFYPTFNDNSKYVHVIVEGSSDGQRYVPVFNTDLQKEGYFAVMIWYHVPLDTTENMRFFRVRKNDYWNRLVIAEIAFEDGEGHILAATPADDLAKKMLDEPQTVRQQSTNKNSAIFDESYFPSSAAEMQDGRAAAEMDHPPFARLIIGLGMSLFGRNPFGFRVTQVIFGIVMIPLLYLFALKLWGKVWPGLLAALLLAVDFMHYTQTRLGTLDAYLAVFILLMFFFLYAYHIETHRVKRRLYLLGSGLFTAFAVSTKWSGCYAALGLAVLYFYWLFSDVAADRDKLSVYLVDSLWCVVFFIGIPALVYLLSYIPYRATLEDPGSLLQVVVDHTKTLLAYHTGASTYNNHPYSSRWWTWLLALKPVFYYWDKAADIRIYAAGNPMVWGLGLLGVVFALIRGIAKRQDGFLTIAVAYFSQLIPWFFIGRDTFLYHYYPMVAFLILGVCAMFEDGVRTKSLAGWHRGTVLCFTVLSGADFVAAFPYTYGLPLSATAYDAIRITLLVIGLLMMAFYFGLRLTDWLIERKSAGNEGRNKTDTTKGTKAENPVPRGEAEWQAVSTVHEAKDSDDSRGMG